MDDVKKLRQRVADLRAKGKERLGEAEALEAKEVRSDAETKRMIAIDAELTELQGQLEVAKAELDAAEAKLERQRAFQDAGVALPQPNNADPMCGFQSAADFALAVFRSGRPGAMVDQRLGALQAAPTNFHQETGTSEGYMVPPAIRQDIWTLMTEEDSLLNLVDAEPTESNAVSMLVDQTTPWGASGIIAYWRAEGSQMSPTKLDTDGRMVRLNELYAFVLATEELLQDAPRLNSRLTMKSASALNWKIDDAIWYGNGVGQPLGFFNHASMISVAKESGQAADTIVTANVAKMYSRLLPGGLSRAVWLGNSDIVPQLVTLTIGNQPVWTGFNGGLREAPNGLLMGRPLRFTEHAKTVGDLGDLMFIDPKGYYAARKAAGVQFASSIHLYFDYNMQAFRWTFRMGGQPILSAAIDPANGSNTKSHFVALAARA